MAEITQQFVLGAGGSSYAIARFSGGPLSHVDARLPDGRLLGARFDKCGGQPSGVRIRCAGYEQWKSRIVYRLETTPVQAARYYDFLQDQLGKPYDWSAILGFAFNRNWRDPRKWYCSELQAAAMEYAEITSRLFLPAYKITPVMLALVMSALGATVHQCECPS